MRHFNTNKIICRQALKSWQFLVSLKKEMRHVTQRNSVTSVPLHTLWLPIIFLVIPCLYISPFRKAPLLFSTSHQFRCDQLWHACGWTSLIISVIHARYNRYVFSSPLILHFTHLHNNNIYHHLGATTVIRREAIFNRWLQKSLKSGEKKSKKRKLEKIK